MAMRKLVLGSAGSLVLAGALVASVPSSAQSAEEAEPQHLTQQQAAPATAAPAPADAAAYDAAQAQYNQAQAKYNTQVQEYNDKTRAYQTQRDAYTAKVNDYQSKVQVYNDQARRYDNDVVVVETAMPDTVILENTAPTRSSLTSRRLRLSSRPPPRRPMSWSKYRTISSRDWRFPIRR